jgi:peptide subunit release factor RF-3
VLAEAGRRRAFAVISHPDAGMTRRHDGALLALFSDK